jgi:hypothetical protein
MSNIAKRQQDPLVPFEGRSPERDRMNQALARLGPGPASSPPRRDPARLIFALDLTSSRERSLNQARIATAAMFDAVTAIGAVQVRMIYYRGDGECQISAWHADPEILSQTMRRLSCEAGGTQIARVLRIVLAQPEKISAVVFIGDHCEDDSDALEDLARELGRRSRPLYIFHECADRDPRSLQAKPVFKSMAAASGGIYVEFKPDSGGVLRELLSSVAAFSAGGKQGLTQIQPAATPQARQLQNRLLLAAGGTDEKGK